MKKSPPAAFLSYAHLDEDSDAGRISELATKLSGKVSLYLGQPFVVFVDRTSIEWGGRWPEKITEALDEALFLIPVLTPAYFQSKACREEYRHFAQREKKLGRRDLVLPIYYVEADRLERARWSSRKGWVAELASRQYVDWRKIRMLPSEAAERNRIAEMMGQQIKSAIMQPRVKMSNREDGVTKASVELSPSEATKAYADLSQTQRLIVVALYTHVHPPEIAIDEFLSLMQEKFVEEKEIETTAEFFYRLKDLAHAGLVILKPLGRRTTLVCGIPKIAKALQDKQYLAT